MKTLTYQLNQWESEFFARQIITLQWLETADNARNLAPDFDISKSKLVQAKVASSDWEAIDWLQGQGFQWVEGEVEFRLDLAEIFENPTACKVAGEGDLIDLQDLFGNAFPHSRFRPPYFSVAENQRFYRQWITNAVRGQFDDLCLISRSASGQLRGGISVKLNGSHAKIGLLAVAEAFQGQGIATELLSAAVAWAKANGAEQLTISTQISNLPAINLYQKFGAKIVATAFWFYQ
ncbi:hypothetical protein B0187_00540 [Haemophilus paracuniculus]|uniref:N-acetyltransferase domain-containing protein n=1 Tax=Haemophilus paracuniculus TaxID=734 RepID=A0A1T0AV50_9PAST|nr:dTDP-4-amino-4,6-dideoxy-D-galactose acyltransferase [Haemophilus paracuniculus]OOS00820.1 hypothetical protein B0187_00540 [Haemophilus paracuniculus]